MSVEQAIHERWENTFPLTALVPINRIYTGQVPATDDEEEDVTRPYVGVMVDPKEENIRTSSKRLLSKGNCLFGIYADTLGEVKAIVREIVNSFNRSDFAYSQGTILDMRPGTESYQQDPDDGVWQGTLAMSFLLQQTDRTGVTA